jgi:hypothetical protein
MIWNPLLEISSNADIALIREALALKKIDVVHAAHPCPAEKEGYRASPSAGGI